MSQLWYWKTEAQLPPAVLTHRLSPELGGQTQHGEKARVGSSISFTPLFLDLPAFWAKVIPSAIGMVTDGVVGLDKIKKSKGSDAGMVATFCCYQHQQVPDNIQLLRSLEWLLPAACHTVKLLNRTLGNAPRGKSHLNPIPSTDWCMKWHFRGVLADVSAHSTWEIHLPGALVFTNPISDLY